MKVSNKIDVLIAVYNRKPLLLECLKSLFNQTFKDFKTIVVDDGSSQEMNGIKERVDIYKKINHKGISGARNELMKLADAKYIFILDSDDRVTPDCLEKMYNFAEENNTDWLFPAYNMVNERGITVCKFKTKVQTIKEMLCKKYIPHSGSLIKRNTMKGIWYDEQLTSAVDLDLTFKYLFSGDKKIIKIDEKLLLYVYHQQGRESGTKKTS